MCICVISSIHKSKENKIANIYVRDGICLTGISHQTVRRMVGMTSEGLHWSKQLSGSSFTSTPKEMLLFTVVEAYFEIEVVFL